jgi:hypothetical protein
VSVSDYWARIKMLPLHGERESTDGDALLFRDNAGNPVRIEKPDRHSDEVREAYLAFYEQMYSPGLAH